MTSIARLLRCAAFVHLLLLPLMNGATNAAEKNSGYKKPSASIVKAVEHCMMQEMIKKNKLDDADPQPIIRINIKYNESNSKNDAGEFNHSNKSYSKLTDIKHDSCLEDLTEYDTQIKTMQSSHWPKDELQVLTVDCDFIAIFQKKLHVFLHVVCLPKQHYAPTAEHPNWCYRQLDLFAFLGFFSANAKPIRFEGFSAYEEGDSTSAKCRDEPDPAR